MIMIKYVYDIALYDFLFTPQDPKVSQSPWYTLMDLSHILSPWYCIWLVVLTILKNSQWEGLSHILYMENKKCLKPPTRIYIYIYVHILNLSYHFLSLVLYV